MTNLKNNIWIERKDIDRDRDRTNEGQETPDRKYWIDKSWGEYLPTGLNIDKKKRIKNESNTKSDQTC